MLRISWNFSFLWVGVVEFRGLILVGVSGFVVGFAGILLFGF